MRVTSARIAALLSVLVVLSACSERTPGPTGITASRTGLPFASGLASPTWQAMAANRAIGLTPPVGSLNPLQATHAYALVGVAQYLAVQQADAAAGSDGRSQFEAERGAVAGASAVVLTYLFPGGAPAYEALVMEQSSAGPGQPNPWFARGEAIGREVGAAIVTRAQGDGYSRVVNPVTPWFLTSASQFRPDPPPAFGSATFNAALAEIRNLSDNRTAEQRRIAAAWAYNTGTITPPGFWLQVATDGINAHGLSERETTHLYALLSATMLDAAIGCWDAKLTYWLVRPWIADPGIVVVIPEVGKPNHPSYPSGHSCVSASAAEVISTFFPDERAQLDAMVIEAGLSRMYGGIHYGFDITAGQDLGRNVARFTIAADASGNSLLTPH